MMRVASLCLLAAGLTTAVSWDPAEQAQRGRTAYRAAVTALRAGDSTAALAQLRVAHEAWPAQPAYSEGLVRVAARLGDAATVTSTLEMLAAQGLGASAAADSAVQALAAQHAGVERALAAVLRASAGPVRSASEIVHRDTLFFPEGFDVDERSGTRFITSLRYRNVWVMPLSAAGRWLLPEHGEADRGRARGAVFGAKLTPDGRSIWLALAPTAHMQKNAADSALLAEIWLVDVATGALRRRVTLGDGKGTPGELSIHADGSVLVSDATLGRLYRLRADADTVETLHSPLLRSPQGIAVLGDGRTAIVADWSHGLLRWDLVSNAISAMETPTTMALLGIDGLLSANGSLIAVQNGVQSNRVLRISLDPHATRVLSAETLDRPAENAGEFTVAAVQGQEILYVASSAWPFWNDNAQRLANTGPLPPVTLRRFRLPLERRP